MADQVIHYRDGSDNIKQIVHGPDNELVATTATFKTSDTNTTGLVVEDNGSNSPRITTSGTDQDLFLAASGSGLVEVQSGTDLYTNGLRNTAVSPQTRAVFLRNSKYGALDAARTSQGNIADGQTSSSLQFGIRGDNGNAALGYFWMEHLDPGNNTFFLTAFSDGVSTFDEQNVIEARADRIRLMESDLTFTTDGTNQRIEGAGSITFDSYLRTNGMRNTATTGPNRGIFTRNSKNGALELRRTGQGDIADGQTSTSLQFAIEGDDGNRFPGIIWMEYADPGNQTFFLTSYSNPTSGSGEQNVMEARADRIFLMEGSLRMQKFTNDVVIKPGPGLAYSFESADNDQVLSISDDNIIVKTNNAEIMKFTDNEISTQQPLVTKGLRNNATSAPDRAQFNRNSVFGAINIGRTGQGNLASEQTSSSLQYLVEGDDGDAFTGIVFMDYNTSKGNGFLVDVYDDGVNTFTQRTVLEARADNFKVLEGDLTFTTDGTDQTIDAAGKLNIASDLDITGGHLVTSFGASDGDVLTWNSSNSQWEAETPAAGGGGGISIAVIKGTETFQSLTVPQATFTTLEHSFSEVVDLDGIVTVSGDTFTISAAGTYIIEYNGVDNIYATFAPTNTTNQSVASPYCQIQLYDDTASAEVETWHSERITIGANSTVSHTHQLGQTFMRSVVTLSASNTYSIRYKTFDGLRTASANIVYAYDNGPSVMITKIA